MKRKKLSRWGFLKSGTAVTLGVVAGFVLCTAVIIAFPACANLPSEQPALTPGAVDQTVAAVNSSQEWTPYIAEISGVQMALVPPGCFQMGVTQDQIAYLSGFAGSMMEPRDYADQMPAHEVCFAEPFWIDVHEVTQEQFAGFNGRAERPSYFPGADLPREQISWSEAAAFCAQRDARLPTEAEWEYAARGPDSTLFPWGDTFDCRKGNFDDTNLDDDFLIPGSPFCDGFSTTSPVGSLGAGASWVGVLDLAGNVWEWVADRYDGRTYDARSGGSLDPQGPLNGDIFVVRGGAWSINEVDHLSAAFRGGIDPATAVEHLGFRCARSGG